MSENAPRIENPRMNNIKAALDAAEIFAKAKFKGNPEAFQKDLNETAINNIKNGPVAHEE